MDNEKVLCSMTEAIAEKGEIRKQEPVGIEQTQEDGMSLSPKLQA